MIEPIATYGSTHTLLRGPLLNEEACDRWHRCRRPAWHTYYIEAEGIRVELGAFCSAACAMRDFRKARA